MCNLGHILDSYEPLFVSAGYARRSPEPQGPSFSAPDGRAVVYDRMKEGSLRCFLCIGPRPDVEAETPWWHTTEDATLETAVAESWHFLEAAGFRFLASPTDLTVTEWSAQHNLLVRDRRPARLTITWPAAWSLHQLITAAKRSIPRYQRLSALQIRAMLERQRMIVVSDLSYLQAWELLPQLQQQGFTADLQRL